MKKKVGTILEEELLFKAKQVALSQDQSLSRVFEDALKMYLFTSGKNNLKKQRNISQNTRGSMKVSKTALKAIMEEEDVYEA